MKVLLAGILVLLVNPIYGQSEKEAIAITPNRQWVKNLDNSTWYYGYYKDGKFSYARAYAGGLSDLSSLYPLSYRFGEMRNQPRIQFVYESYEAQFQAANYENANIRSFRAVIKREAKPVVGPVVPFVKGKSKGFDWVTKPGKKKESDFNW